MAAQIWAIGAGKGGVGKTFTCSSLGITLSKQGSSVLLVDFDLTGANLHTTLGLPLTERNLRQFFCDNAKLVDVIQGSEVPRLSYIQGYWDSWSFNELETDQIIKLVEECKAMPYDYILFDLGAGPTKAHLEIFKRADEKILITNAEPTSVEKTYRFLEAYLFSKIKDSSTIESCSELEKKLREHFRDYRNSNQKNQFSFRNYLKNSPGFTPDFFEIFSEKPVRLIVNSARTQLDQNLGYSIKSVCKKYYDFDLDYVGSVDFNNAVWQSVQTRGSVLLENPFTPLAGQFSSISKRLVNSNLDASLYKAVI